MDEEIRTDREYEWYSSWHMKLLRLLDVRPRMYFTDPPDHSNQPLYFFPMEELRPRVDKIKRHDVSNAVTLFIIWKTIKDT